MLAIQSDTVESYFTGVTWLSKEPPDYRGLQAANFSALEMGDWKKYDIGAVWDVSRHSRWSGFLRVPIAGVRIYYGPSLVDGLPSANDCVMDLALEFANGQTVTFAGNALYIDGQVLHRQGDGVVMVFGEDAALALGVGEFATPPWMEHSNLAPGLSQDASWPGLAPTLSREPENR